MLISACSSGADTLPTASRASTEALGIKTTFGVSVKNFTQPSKLDFETLAAMGIKTVRLDLGNTDGMIAKTNAVIDAYRAGGIQVIGIAPYVQKGDMFTSATIARDSAWVSELAPKLFALELQNEPNKSTQEQLTPDQYDTLAQAVAASARLANPAITISSGGTSGYDPGWLSQTVPSLAQSIDCIGVHPYGLDPSTFGNVAATVYNTYQKPMCQTEWGASDAESGNRVRQAAESSKGLVPIFVFFTLGELEENPSFQAAYTNL